jgi:carbon storage regulator CsrA
MMLVLTRKQGEAVVINDLITVRVVDVCGDKVRLAVVAPGNVPVHRQEVYEAIHGGPAGGLTLAPMSLAAVQPGPGGGREVRTEAEWLACADPRPMLEWLQSRASARKLRLFACACCRGVWEWMTDTRSRSGVEVAERYADGLAGAEELQSANEETGGAWTTVWGDGWHIYQSARAAHCTCSARADRLLLVPEELQNAARNFVPANAGQPAAQQAGSSERERQTSLLRDVFGNPFRPVALDPAWRTADVAALGQAAYEERALPGGTLEPDRLAVLADALEGAGCADDEVLRHLRGPGPHVRGCWAVDLLLGKE